MTINTAAPRSIPLPDIPAPATGQDLPDEIIVPDPVGHFMLVALPTMKEKTAGGVIILDSVNERERTAAMTGQVIALGPDCYEDKTRFPNGAWCKEGDIVMFSRYAGHRFRSLDVETAGMVEYRMMSDDLIVGVVPTGSQVEGI